MNSIIIRDDLRERIIDRSQEYSIIPPIPKAPYVVVFLNQTSQDPALDKIPQVTLVEDETIQYDLDNTGPSYTNRLSKALIALNSVTEGCPVLVVIGVPTTTSDLEAILELPSIEDTQQISEIKNITIVAATTDQVVVRYEKTQAGNIARVGRKIWTPSLFALNGLNFSSCSLQDLDLVSRKPGSVLHANCVLINSGVSFYYPEPVQDENNILLLNTVANDFYGVLISNLMLFNWCEIREIETFNQSGNPTGLLHPHLDRYFGVAVTPKTGAQITDTSIQLIQDGSAVAVLPEDSLPSSLNLKGDISYRNTCSLSHGNMYRNTGSLSHGNMHRNTGSLYRGDMYRNRLASRIISGIFTVGISELMRALITSSKPLLSKISSTSEIRANPICYVDPAVVSEETLITSSDSTFGYFSDNSSRPVAPLTNSFQSLFQECECNESILVPMTMCSMNQMLNSECIHHSPTDDLGLYFEGTTGVVRAKTAGVRSSYISIKKSQTLPRNRIRMVYVNASDQDIELRLPEPDLNFDGRRYVFKRIDTSNHTVKLISPLNYKIDGRHCIVLKPKHVSCRCGHDKSFPGNAVKVQFAENNYWLV